MILISDFLMPGLFTIHYYSVLKLLTGLATAAFIAWKLTVAIANTTVAKAATAKTFHVTEVR